MARLSALPSQAVISAYKGKVDFYMYMGIPCARMWPTWGPRTPYVLEKANQDVFVYITTHLSSMPDYEIDQYKRMAQGTPWTWRDLAIHCYFKGLPT